MRKRTKVLRIINIDLNSSMVYYFNLYQITAYLFDIKKVIEKQET